MVATETTGNMTRPPNLSVRAPIGMRPNDPTTTGTATSSACWNAERCRLSLNLGPSGLSRAQAQKLTAKPMVARASIRTGRPLIAWSLRRGVGRSGVRVPGTVVMSSSSIGAAKRRVFCLSPFMICPVRGSD